MVFPRLTCWLFAFLYLYPVIAQESLNQHLGFSIGYGSQLGQELNYEYRVWLFQGEYKNTLFDWGSWKIKLMVSPQFNIAQFKDRKEYFPSKSAFELGINVALLVQKKLLDKISLFTGLASGPHYVSDVPDRQASGFIFSDHVIAGFEIFLPNRLSLDLTYAFRHMSNLSIKKPNGGINNTVFFLGVSKQI